MSRYQGRKASYKRRARGRMFKREGKWYYEVRDAYGKVVLTDNQNDYDKLMREVMLSVWAVRRIEIAGHYLEYSWPEILRYRVDEIPGELRNNRAAWLVE